MPLPIPRMCSFTRSRRFETAYMSLSLFFGNRSPTPFSIYLLTRAPFLDAMAFSVVVFVSFGTGPSFGAGLSLPGGRPGILRTILEDATVYFLVIFSSHLLALVVALATRVSSNIFAPVWAIVTSWFSLHFNFSLRCEFDCPSRAQANTA